MLRILSASIGPAVVGVSGTCRLTTSLAASSASRLSVGSVLPWRSLSVRSKKITRMPRASARFESRAPIFS